MITLPKEIQSPVQDFALSCQEQLRKTLLLCLSLIVILAAAFYLDNQVWWKEIYSYSYPFLHAVMVVISPFGVYFFFQLSKRLKEKNDLTVYQKLVKKLDGSCLNSSIKSIDEATAEACFLMNKNHLVKGVFEHYQPLLATRKLELYRKALTDSLNAEFEEAMADCAFQLQSHLNNVPLLKVKTQIESSLKHLRKRYKEMNAQWLAAYEKFSLWNKIKYSDGPDFYELKSEINKLSDLLDTLESDYGNDFKNLKLHFDHIELRAIDRLLTAKETADSYIQCCNFKDSKESNILQKSLWLSALSVPVSAWSDVQEAGEIYDVLRGVNSNFEGMTDAEVWWETLFLPGESLAGLASLTKGAYFEQLVANDTGGQLFEHFNNPDTDIVIDGVAYQLKATNSESYILSVDESIPVIATSEVALSTGAIDSGISNNDISDVVDNALGGTVLDVGDTTVDAILSGLGGLGLFATLEGINHATKKYEKNGDVEEAIFEGAGVAIEGTAKALVGTAEMSYKILASRPSRFIGRLLLKICKKIEKKLS